MIKNVTIASSIYLKLYDRHREIISKNINSMNSTIDDFLTLLFKKNGISPAHLEIEDLLVNVIPATNITYESCNYKIALFFYYEISFEFEFVISESKIILEKCEVIYFPHAILKRHIVIPLNRPDAQSINYNLTDDIVNFFKQNEETSEKNNVIDILSEKSLRRVF